MSVSTEQWNIKKLHFAKQFLEVHFANNISSDLKINYANKIINCPLYKSDKEHFVIQLLSDKITKLHLAN